MAFVIRSVNAQEPGSAQNGQRMAVTRCEHAIVVVGSGIDPLTRVDIPDAEPVVFGKNGEGVEVVANRAAQELRLGQNELSDVLRMAAMAKEHGVPLLMRLGETQSYVVYHDENRSIDASWAVVECDVEQDGGAGAARTSRRTTAKKSFRCKVGGTAKLERSLLCFREYSSGLIYSGRGGALA